MTRRLTITRADIRRAMLAAKESGLVVNECIMRPQEVRIIFTNLDNEQETIDISRPKQWPR